MTKVGEKLGRYELVEQLGKGAAGTVFRARDTLLGIDVCVKVLHPGLSTQPGIIERFKRELLLARRVAHPGICKIFDIQEAGNTNFLTMEYVKGETLSTILNRDGQMHAKDAIRVMRKVAEALAAAHRAGVVHRDIKPGNIIIGDSERVTIVDFGVATAEDLDRLTRAGVVLGSRSYMAPETWQGKPATAGGDVWALGVILYGCVTGRLPYKGEGVVGVFDAIKNTKPVPPSAYNSDVTPELEKVIFKAMCVEPNERYPDAGAVESALATLEATLDDEGVATVVRAPSFAGGPSAKPPAAPSMPPMSRPPPPSSTAGAALAAKLPEPPPAERLHRPSPSSLPKPPPSTPGPAARAGATPPTPFGRPPSSTSRAPASASAAKAPPPSPSPAREPIAMSSDEMSLYAGESAVPSDQAESTRVMSTPTAPGAPLVMQSPLEADSVAEAFDAAFGLGASASQDSLPITDPQHDVVDFSKAIAAVKAVGEAKDDKTQVVDDAPLAGMNLLLGQTVASESGVERRFRPGERASHKLAAGATDPPAPPPNTGWEVQRSDEIALATRPPPPPEEPGDATQVAANPLLVVQGEPSGQFNTIEAMPPSAEQSLYMPDDEGPADVELSHDDLVDSTRIEEAPVSTDFSAPSLEPLVAIGEPLTAPTKKVPRPVTIEARAARPGGKNKGLLVAAASGSVVIALGLAIVLLWGDDKPEPAGAGASPPTATGDAPAGDWQFDDEKGGEKPAPVGSQPAKAEAPSEPPPAATEPPPAATEPPPPAVVESEPPAAEPEPPVAAAKPPVAEEPDEPEELDEPEVALATTRPKSHGPSPDAAARAKFKKKKNALDAVLAKRGIIPGDVASIDSHRRAMTSASKGSQWSRAADSADKAADEATAVKIDAAFVGKKLARFNQGYDKIKDEAKRQKLKGALKDVAQDMSKKQWDDANKKLNKAFTLMNAR